MTSHTGLTNEEAKKRFVRDGPNEVVPSRFESGLEDIKKILLDPMGLMLLALAGLHGFIGDRKDAFILLGAYIPVVAVDVLLELRAQRALKAMRSTLSSVAKVLRDGQISEVPIREIVVGDVLIFEEGQALPADGNILESSNLAASESALTGESVPVEKSSGQAFFAGTTILQGRGLGYVEKIGKNTQFGKIASLLEETKAQQSPLQKKVNHLIKYVLIIAIGLAVFLFIIEWARGYGVLQSLITALTFGMAAVPEEFPIVFTLYLSLGAWRLSKHGVLIRSLPSVEALGSVDVICTDKTGTLTEGRFQLESLYSLNPSYPPEKLWQVALMACEEDAVDSMEMAIKEKGQNFSKELQGWRLTQDYPFEVTGKHMSHVWIHSETKKSLIAMKGAVEGVLEHCDISAEARRHLMSTVESFASQGQRILGMAVREGISKGVREEDEKGLTFLGLLLFSDPVRESAREAISVCQKAGIEIKMLTGDHPLTALAVADQTGIIHSNDFLYSGHQLNEMSVKDRMVAYQKGAIFSRVLPEQKYEMVKALKNSGKVVAMTGDGINDAPALKLADIGISMGLTATDVARSTAQMVLVKNDFRGLVEAVFEGRRIFENLRRSFSYLISFHIPVILLALIPPLFGWGDLLLPIHIVLLEMLVHPISAFAFENLPNSDGGLEKSILPLKRLLRSGSAGLMLSLIALWLFHSQQRGNDLTVARSYSMAALFIGNIVFVLIESGFSTNKRVLWTIFGLLMFGGIVFCIPPITILFHLHCLCC